VREYTYLYGTVCPDDGETDFLILPHMDATCMNIFIEEVSRRYKDEFILMICDGAPCHSDGALDLPKNMEIAKLPPYSPQLNPAENIWDEIREKFFCNTVFDSMNAVENQIVEAANFYEKNPQITKSTADWDWIINSYLTYNYYQYCSADFQKTLKTHQAICSMSRKGNCRDNAVAERFFRSLKTERVYFRKYRTRDEARRDIIDYIEMFYNSERRHSTLGYMNPMEFEVKNILRKAA